jgi:hypothetical protein
MKARFENRTCETKLNVLINKANGLLSLHSVMLEDVLNKNDFKYNSGDGARVFNHLITCDKVAPVFFYKPKWIWSKAMGYSDGKAIHLNSRKFGSFSEADIIGLLIHEYSHIAGFSHGSNYPSEEKNKFSVPYFLSSNIEKWL